ncbi:hypothetical protein HPULCUR_010143 [Helicostylum pulchrum]|uniref:Uncharacterized protein n=1 Tax=Helicostylum pulchrum TaxID=562976 RepID=A0ABP9YCF3_9FUNG
MNLKVSRLHQSTPFSVMFNRRANDFENYTQVNPNFDIAHIQPEAIAAQYKKVTLRRNKALIANHWRFCKHWSAWGSAGD